MGAIVQVVKVEGKVLSVIREGGLRTSHGHGGHGGHGGEDVDGDDAHGGGDSAHEKRL